MKKVFKIILISLLCIALVWGGLALAPRPQNFPLDNPMRKEGELPILIAHGGGNREFPDNTLEAFYNAYSVDPRVMLETDVSITKDGVVLLSHDTTLDRKTNVTGPIIDWNYADLISQKVDFGTGFTRDDGSSVTPMDVSYPAGVSARDEKVFLATTLEDLILCFPENSINVEIKQSGETGLLCLKEVLRLLQEHDAWDRVVLASFHDEIYNEYLRLQAAKEVPETFMYSPSTGGATKFVVLQMLGLDVFFRDGMCVFQLPTEELGLNLASQRLVNAAHRHNLAVHYWTINDPEEMARLIDIGADGIMTDYPHRLQEVYENYNG